MTRTDPDGTLRSLLSQLQTGRTADSPHVDAKFHRKAAKKGKKTRGYQMDGGWWQSKMADVQRLHEPSGMSYPDMGVKCSEVMRDILQAANKVSRIRELNLCSNPFDVATVAPALLSMRDLAAIDMTGHAFITWSGPDPQEANVAAAFGRVVCGCPRLTVLNLSKNNLHAHELVYLMPELAKGHLRKLDLSRNKFGDEGARTIADHLPSFTRLQRLVIKHNVLGADALHSIQSASTDAHRRCVVYDEPQALLCSDDEEIEYPYSGSEDSQSEPEPTGSQADASDRGEATAELDMDIVFDDALFRVTDMEAGRVVDVTAAAEETLRSMVMKFKEGIIESVDNHGNLCVYLTGTEWSGFHCLWPLRLLFDRLTVKRNQHGRTHVKVRPAQTATDILPFVALSRHVFHDLFDKKCPVDWSDGSGSTPVPSAQLMFVVACATRMQWTRFIIRPGYLDQRKDEKDLDVVELPPLAVRSQLVVHAPGVTEFFLDPDPDCIEVDRFGNVWDAEEATLDDQMNRDWPSFNHPY
jgi:hypothetical protein